MPFLENVTRGRGIPRERLAEVGEHYFLFGGRSPINDQCRSCWPRCEPSWIGRGIDAAAVLGQPQLGAVPGRRRCGRSRRPGTAGCWRSPPARTRRTRPAGSTGRTCTTPSQRHAACRSTGSGTTPTIPGFVAASVDATLAAARPARRARAAAARLVFVTHSIPTAMAESVGTAAAQRRGRLRRLAPGRSPPR